MKDYTNNKPSFSDTIKIPETTDTNHADNINMPIKQLLDNDIVLKAIFDRLVDELKRVAYSGSYNDLGDKPSSFPPSSHKHTKSEITDFPSSMPANDVPAWAKAANKPSYNWSEIGSKPSIPAAVRVKGNAESSYRTGDVNLTPANIGAAPANHSHSDYAPKANPSFTGTITLASGGRMVSQYGNQLTFYTSSGNCTAFHGVSVSSGTSADGYSSIYGADNGCSCGTSNLRWRQVYAVSSAISTSDKREKYDISYIGKDSGYDTNMSDELLEALVMGFKPVVFKRSNGDSQRPHHGIIAQDFEELLKKTGLQDHAAFIKSPVTKMKETEIKGEDGKTYLELKEVVVPDEYRYGLRYEELISDVIRFCQLLKNENISQQKKIENLEERLAKLENS